MAKMRVTFETDEGDLKLAEELCSRQNTTLNELFRAWLREIAERVPSPNGEVAISECRSKVYP